MSAPAARFGMSLTMSLFIRASLGRVLGCRTGFADGHRSAWVVLCSLPASVPLGYRVLPRLALAGARDLNSGFPEVHARVVLLRATAVHGVAENRRVPGQRGEDSILAPCTRTP